MIVRVGVRVRVDRGVRVGVGVIVIVGVRVRVIVRVDRGERVVGSRRVRVWRLPTGFGSGVAFDEAGEHGADAIREGEAGDQLLIGDEAVAVQTLEVGRHLTCFAARFDEALTFLLG